MEGHPFQAMQVYLDQYGYWAVFAGILFEDFGVPLPGETLLVAGAMLAARGDFNIAWLLALAAVGAVVGDSIGYLIGRFGGRRLVLRWGRYVLLDEPKLAKLEGFFGRHGGKVVVGARFFQGLRQLNGVIAGIAGMPWERFLLFNLLGAVLWVGVWGTAGYVAGRHMAPLLGGVMHLSGRLLVTLAAVVLLAIGGYLIARR